MGPFKRQKRGGVANSVGTLTRTDALEPWNMELVADKLGQHLIMGDTSSDHDACLDLE